jgi:hypothetical protein
MQLHQKIQDITNIDIVTLKHFAEAQNTDAPTPPAFTDTLVRLSRRGFICGGQDRPFLVTPKGRDFLVALEKPSVGFQTH